MQWRGAGKLFPNSHVSLYLVSRQPAAGRDEQLENDSNNNGKSGHSYVLHDFLPSGCTWHV